MRSLLLLILLLLPPVAGADEAADLLADNQLLTAELQLARSGKLYLLFDLRDQVILLKSSGVILSSLPLREAKLYGPVPAPTAHLLDRRETADPPQREALRVPDQADDSAAARAPERAATSLQALERDDMPDSYRLILADGTRISVHAESAGMLATAGRAGHAIADIGARGRHVIKGLVGNQAAGELRLTLAPADARQLYWSFAEQSACLIRPPATSP
jgi:hypothetical protein